MAENGGGDIGRLPICAGVEISRLFWILRASKVTPQDIVEDVDGVCARKAEGLEFLVEVEERALTMRGALLQLVEALEEGRVQRRSCLVRPGAQKATVAGVKAVAQDLKFLGKVKEDQAVREARQGGRHLLPTQFVCFIIVNDRSGHALQRTPIQPVREAGHDFQQRVIRCEDRWQLQLAKFLSGHLQSWIDLAKKQVLPASRVSANRGLESEELPSAQHVVVGQRCCLLKTLDKVRWV